MSGSSPPRACFLAYASHLTFTRDRALQPGCDAEPRFRGVRYSTGGLQPTLAVRRLSSATTPGGERDGPSMRARGVARISLAVHSAAIVNPPSPRPYGERVGVRGSGTL